MINTKFSGDRSVVKISANCNLTREGMGRILTKIEKTAIKPVTVNISWMH